MFGSNNGFGLDLGALLGSILPKAGENNGNNSNDMWGGGGWMWMWWIWIILFFFFGWGNEGGPFGNRGNNCSNGSGSNMVGYSVPFGASFTDAAVQRGFDNQGVMNKLNGLENGICSLGYDILGQFNGVGQQIAAFSAQNAAAIAQLGYNNQLIANQNQIADMQRDFAIQQQFAQCCCDQKQQAAQTRYDMATLNCGTNTLIQNVERNVTDAVNGVGNRIIDYLCQKENQQLLAENQQLKFSNQLNCFGDSIVERVRPTAGPAWLVQNPNSSYPYPQNNNCCCNNQQTPFNFGF